MNERLFRKISLERLASPEQLDQLLRVTSPRGWIGLSALFLLLASMVVWAFEGSIATKASGQGVIVRTGGVLNVVSRGSGLILSLDVKVGDKIQANQTVARIAEPVLVEKMKASRDALAEARGQRQSALEIHKNQARLQLDAVQREIANGQRQVQELEEQAKLATEDIPVEEQLLAKGLVTKQQTIATRQKLITIQGQIATVQAQLKQLEAQKFSVEASNVQVDEEMKPRISNLERDVAGMEQELSLAQNVVSPYGGEVLELKVYAGVAVASGQPILSIQPDDQHLEVLAYLPSIQAKDVKNEMEVQISPSTIKREEFGFMKGRVLYVSDYPATTAALMRNFQNEMLVTSLSGTGPVTEIRVALETDANAPSGFRWSTPKGAPVVISGGTICNLDIVTRRQRPATLVLPYAKQKLGLE
jgi:HlyD family secretion protein